ncbi:MAG TPA: hypothetical protein VKM55_19690 [Candidatus Lokiarchaeia archaeon]|nr:hypothetical protein [Candidatus Lokiarchaeia archaeon]
MRYTRCPGRDRSPESHARCICTEWFILLFCLTFLFHEEELRVAFGHAILPGSSAGGMFPSFV